MRESARAREGGGERIERGIMGETDTRRARNGADEHQDIRDTSSLGLYAHINRALFQNWTNSWRGILTTSSQDPPKKFPASFDSPVEPGKASHTPSR